MHIINLISSKCLWFAI